MRSLKEYTLRVAGVIEESIVDGPGIRFVLFLQGCRLHCPGCQNPHTWDFEGGTLVPADEVLARIKGNPLVHGVTFSGGEPFEQAEALLPLAEVLKEQGYNLIAFTGYTLEQLLQKPECAAFLEKLDLLVDGPFIEAQKSLALRFRGSRNQRIINVPATRASGWQAVLDELNEAVER